MPPSEACLYCHINWSLAQAQQQFSKGLDLSQSATSMRGGRARPRAGFWFNVQKWPVAHSNGDPVAKKPHSDPRMESPHSGRKSCGGGASAYACVADVLWSTTSSASPSSLGQVGTLPHFLDQWRSITSNRFVLNMVKGHHL